MKSALCAIAAVLILGVCASGGVGSPLAGVQVPVASHSESQRTVFVDKAELGRLHPGWQDLHDTKVVLADALRSPVASKNTHNGRSRSELAAKAALDASAALDGLEARKYAALKARRDALKAQMMKSAEADWKADARNVEEAAAVDTKSIDDKYALDLVNARIRVSAAQAASKVAELDGSGMDQAAAKQSLEDAQSVLKGAVGANDTEKAGVVADANVKVEALKQAAEKRIDDQLRSYEREQGKRIADSISEARTEIAKELGPSSAPVLFAEEVKSDQLLSLRSKVLMLQARIDRDVDLLVRDLAAKQGVRVVYERRGGNVPNATALFAGLIKKHGWNAGGPDGNGLGSS